MAKDFFDEEYDKLEQKEAAQRDAQQQKFDSWSGNVGAGGGNSSEVSKKRPLYIALICFALVLALVLGWVLCAIFGSTQTGKSEEKYALEVVKQLVEVLNEGKKDEEKIVLTDAQLQSVIDFGNDRLQSGQITNEMLLSDVMDYLRDKYYKEISEEAWINAVQAAGTALLQTAGDRFCSLMSPQSYYDYMHQTSAVLATDRGYFGISYQYSSGLGLLVSDVYADSSCYGLIKSNDIVLKMSDIVYNVEEAAKQNIDTSQTEIVFADMDSTQSANYMAVIDSADFHLLRQGRVHETGIVSRGPIGFNKGKYNYQFVEFYFNDDCNNISTTNKNKAQYNTYSLRGLKNLPKDTGYIRITQFMFDGSGSSRITADQEFRKVMADFHELGLKRLVLDLKGNPGGLVSAVCNIAGMLVTDQKLSAEEQSIVKSGGKLLITKLIPRDEKKAEPKSIASSYNKYFDAPGQTCDIVVWTDGGSASASELLTGALRDYQTGFQIGLRTYGKGIAQSIEELPYTGTVKTSPITTATEHWAIYYTYAAYYSPLGTNIHGEGYAPEKGYDNIRDYVTEDGTESLWDATYRYWGISK